jgi:hypothetical protein
MADPLQSYWNKYKYTSLFDQDVVQANMDTLVSKEISGLDPQVVMNYESLYKKFPNQSKDYLLSAAKSGLNANSQGIDKLASADGFAQLMQDLTNVDNLKSQAGKDKGFREGIYGILKGSTRATFATLQAPYQYISTVGRNLYAASTGEKPATSLLTAFNPAQLLGETTNLGQLLRATGGLVTGNGPVDTGNGFFVSPESKVGAGQAKAMSAYGRVNGKSFTIGRGSLNVLGMDPNTAPYRVMSGIIDATLAVGTDPSTWFGPGSVTSIIKGGKQLAAAKGSAQAVEEAKRLAKIEDIKNLTKEEKLQLKQFTGEEKKVRRNAENSYLKAEKDLQKKSQAKANAVQTRLEKALNYGIKRGDQVEGNADVIATIETGKIGDFVLKSVADNTPEGVIDNLAQLSADYENVGKAFTGIYLDEVPSPGQLKLGAFGEREYVATVSKDNPLELFDITKNYTDAPITERIAEFDRREQFFGKLYAKADDAATPDYTKQAIYDYINKNDTGYNLLQSSADNLLFSDGSQTLADLMSYAIKTKDENLVSAVSDAVQEVWKYDGFVNIRAIHGGTGGVVVTNASKIGARQLGISDTLTSLNGTAAMGTQLGTKLIESVKSAQQEILDAKTALDSASTSRAGIDGKIKEIDILRDYAAQDPDLVAQLINDPENIGIAKLMDLQTEIADTGYLKEFYRSEVGLVDGFGGSVKGDVDKAATYLLGKRFNQVAEIVANETDFARLHRLFGRKLDAEMTKELVDATTVDEVLSVFLKHLAAPTSDPQIYRSLALKGEAALAAKNPVFKTVPPVAYKAINYVEKIEKNFGRYFTKSVVLPLDDLDRLVNGMEDWMSSAKIPDEIINSTINRIVSATDVRERSGIVFQEIEKAQVALAERLAPGDIALQDAVKEAFRITGRENAIVKNYVAERLAQGEVPSLNILDGQVHNFAPDQAIYEYQFLDDVIRLPDTKDITKLVNKYTNSKLKYGAKQSLEVFSTEIGDRWRTAQLAFRIAYIMRNIGEMQFRQYFSGHESLLNHPINYIAMLAGNPNGKAGQKLLSKIAKYSNDVKGNSLVGKDAELNGSISEFVEENFNFLARNHNSGDPRFAFTGKIYEAIGTDSSKYHVGLSNTLIRAHSDALIPLVARYAGTGQEDDMVRLLIAGEGDKFKGVLESLINGGRNGVETGDFAQIFLRDQKKVNGKYNLKPENIIPENVKSYLFDKTSTGSVARYVDNVAGTGAGSVAIRQLLADGEIIKNGVKIKIPRYSKVGNINDFADEDGAFKSLIGRNFPREDMVDSTVIHVRDKRFGPEDTKYLDKAVSWFFDGATKLENVVNFAPEFRMSYWDHVGRYVGMINDDALDALLVNAKKSLAPLTINGRNISTRRHPSLRAINKEIAARKKGKSITDGIDLDTMNSMAAKKASAYTKDLFYDAAKQRQYANAMRIVFPFAQAQFNTMYKWTQLIKENPVQIYKLGRAYNALTQSGSSAIYDLTGTKYDENQGFFYKDEFGETRFRYPLAGSIIGAMAGKNIDSAQALQITAPVQSLNLVFGAVNPAIPGIGPMGQIVYAASGKSKAFGPEWDSLRQIIFPFGEPSGLQDFFLPSWLKKSFLYAVNNDVQVERGVKDWASYLASSGDYGDNPLANDTERNQLFNDARGLSRWTGLMTAFFQSIAPATPSQEVFAKDKDGKLRTQTALYAAYDQIAQKHPGDYFGAVGEFSDMFGIKNLLVILAGSTRSVRGTGDAWSFLNENPDVADKYATKTGDVVPYFFPGGEAATAYYNWQKATGRRRNLRPEELEQYAENVVYQMAKSQISEQQADLGYSDIWYTEQIMALNNQFGGSAPVMSVDIGSAREKVANVEKALAEPAFQKSPIYNETKQFFDAYKSVEKYLQEVRTTATPNIGSGFWYAKEQAGRLNNLATQLIVQNPAFARMYYGVFASLLKVEE